jgi:sterol desaturase/sphingolipid hydroxylase (fatty acid hydroxylase superfamily)
MTGIWWTSVSIEIFLCSLTATTAHLLMSLGQTLFHRYLGHRGIGGRFFENHLYIHHRNYSGNHVVSEQYLNKESNNTPFFLIPVTLVISLGCLFLPLDLFIVQLTAMSISFYVHLYFDKHYHVAGSWLGRFAWFRRKQQLHFLHHRHADCNFAVVDNFWDWLLGTYGIGFSVPIGASMRTGRLSSSWSPSPRYPGWPVATKRTAPHRQPPSN